MILVRNIRLPLSAAEPQAFEKALHTLRVPRSKVEHTGVAKLSVDARHGQPKLVYTVAVTLKQPGEEAALAARCPDAVLHRRADFTLHAGTQSLAHRPVVCGLGPAGLFAALLLARQGYRPIVLERGPALDARVQAVEHFSATGQLDPNANIQFGEGGAGTFSDGKLTTRIGDELCDFVTEVFLQHGAPAEIAWKQKPHVGTDLLRGVITSIRKEIESLGGEVHFNTALTGLERKNGRLVGITTTNGSFACETLVFAVGHSARDTFSMLMDSGLVLECKPFSVGFRAEHLQTEIEKSLYHEAAGHPALPRGEYQLSQHVEKRCVYTFCMCPGGYVVNASSEEGRLAVNGMSYSGRNSTNANSAVIITITPEDYGDSKDPLSGVAFQRKLEEKAYQIGNGKVPVERYGSFKRAVLGTKHQKPETTQEELKETESMGLEAITPCIKGQWTEAPVHEILPDALNHAFVEGMEAFGKKIHGFNGDEVLVEGIESRTSSPVRILRTESAQSLAVEGLYPCGEGAGYAGGITSAAMDGIFVAEQLARALQEEV